MILERSNNSEFENVLRVSSKGDLPPAARELIYELFERVKALEAKVAETDRS